MGLIGLVVLRRIGSGDDEVSVRFLRAWSAMFLGKVVAFTFDLMRGLFRRKAETAEAPLFGKWASTSE